MAGLATLGRAQAGSFRGRVRRTVQLLGERAGARWPLTALLVRTSKAATSLLGPLHRCDPKRIEIILTFECDLLCVDCSIQCRQAASRERMGTDQIAGFVRESTAQNRRWDVIRVIGGEPTTHPDVLEAMRLLADYKRVFSPRTRVQLCTNGFSQRARDIAAGMPAGIEIENNAKTSQNQKHHLAVNYAPIDQGVYRWADFTNACRVCVTQGLGLSPYGFYHCNVGAAIDRVFGLDIGMKRMPCADDPMLWSAERLCRYCGFFRMFQPDQFKAGYISPTWEAVLARYGRSAPVLTRY